MAPKPRHNRPPAAPDDASPSGRRRPGPDSADERAPDPAKEQDSRLETYEQEVERASVESLAEHPEGSAPPLERLVDAHPEKQRK
jgi:hypothetical protein